MKIGILTYHRSHNYGAVLQAYALKTFLSNQGHDVEFIDYWPNYRKGMYDLADFSFIKDKDLNFPQKIKRLIRLVLVYPGKKNRYKRFQKFIKHHLGIYGNAKFKTGEEITGNYDSTIYGSDQIWRYNHFETFEGFDPVYWGEFPKKNKSKKIAYAASMGIIENTTQNSIYLKTYLRNFNAISVREKELQELLQNFTDKTVAHVLDPVFLLSATQWLKFSSQNQKSKKKFILFYHLNYSKEAIKLTNKIARRNNYSVIEIRGGVTPFTNPFKYKQTLGPIEFINLIFNASFIVSTSFHGVAFSIIFRKKFFALGLKNNSIRVTSLLEELRIPERYLDNLENINFSGNINYDLVESLLNKKKENSVRFLGYLKKTE